MKSLKSIRERNIVVEIDETKIG